MGTRNINDAISDADLLKNQRWSKIARCIIWVIIAFLFLVISIKIQPITKKSFL